MYRAPFSGVSWLHYIHYPVLFSFTIVKRAFFSFYFTAIADADSREKSDTQSAANEATSSAKTLRTNPNSSHEPKAVKLVSSDENSDESFSDEDDDDKDFIVSGDEDAYESEGEDAYESKESAEEVEDCPQILPVKNNTK